MSVDVKSEKIGFIGQGYVGKNYADNFESRGFTVVRYSNELGYKENKKRIEECSIVIVAVPTPTNENGFDDSIVREVITIAKPGTSIVIKSTMALGFTEKIAADFPNYYIFHSPEFLSERSARYDVDNPHASIVGMGIVNEEYRSRAEKILAILPAAPLKKVCTSLGAELIKYSRNVHGFYEILFYNMFYDLSQKLGVDYEILKEYFKHDPLQVYRYAQPVHDSGHTLGKFGRGAGGHCFIKDFKAFKNIVDENLKDKEYTKLLEALEKKNIDLLVSSGKDLDLLSQVYGSAIIKKAK